MKLHEIEAIERHIEKTATAGQEVNDKTFAVLKEFLVERLISCIGSRDSRVRRAAVRVSGKFANLPLSHQKRVIFSMSSRM